MTKNRLDQELFKRKLVTSRSQAESYIRIGKVSVGGRVIMKPGYFVSSNSEILLAQEEQYVSRAGMKLASVAGKFGLDFTNKIILDIGSSTGGFTDYALRHGARKVFCVDVGTDQLHRSLRGNPKIELYEKTDIRDFRLENKPNIILIDVSFISIREILPHVAQYLANKDTQIVAMIKPQFETGSKVKNAGVIKNDTERRKVFKDFEAWAKKLFIIEQKVDSDVAGTRGNLERFFLMKKTS
jgi:hemolysin TlyA family protein